MNPLVDELLNRWEESCERGDPLSAEVLCRDCPELLNELKWQINALKVVDDRFGGGSPSSTTNRNSDVSSARLNKTVQVTTAFQVEELHATGGLGEVYLAVDHGLHRKVAIKFPRADRHSRDHLARFEREAQITAKLSHPGIVPVHAVKLDDVDQPCYVMRFVDGPTLEKRIDELYSSPSPKNSDFYASLEMRHLLQNFISLCNIVAYAHDQGVVHRDIKPANVILGPFGETLLMDWGLAKPVGEMSERGLADGIDATAETVVDSAVKTRAGQFMGTPVFASPEQRTGRVDLIDTRTDIYSLGVTLLVMLTGKLSDAEIIHTAPIKNLAGITIPSRLEAICRKALFEDASDRYQNTTTLRGDIESYLAGEPISVVRETVLSRLYRTVRKRPGWIAAILVGISVTTLAGAIGSWLLNEKNLELSKSNEALGIANARSLASQQRSAATTQLLTKAMQAATPEVAQGKEPSLRLLLDATSQQLKSDPSILPLVAADTSQVLADAYLSMGLYEKAQQHVREAHELYRTHLGENNAYTLSSQATHAVILSKQSKNEEAIEVARDALQRSRSTPDIDARTKAKVLDICAHAISRGTGSNQQESAALHREAFELAEAELGPNDPATLRYSTNLGVALMELGALVEGEKMLVRTKLAHESLLGKLHPETLVDNFNLILLLRKKEDLKEAAILANSQRKPFEEVFGIDHQRTIRLVLLLCQINFGTGDLPAAEQEAKLALERATKALGAANETTLDARGILCAALLAQGKLEEAETLANEQYAQAVAAFGPSSTLTIEAITLLFDMAEARNDVDSMARWFEKLRGSAWEVPAQEALQKAQSKSQQ